MSDPILKWLNNDAKLSKKITNIEQDFANGKLFAEILAKYHQKLSVSTFSNSEQYADKVNNFKLLDPYFRNLNIRIEPKMTDPIIKGERGAALKILYQLKILFDNKNKPTVLTSSLSPEKMGGTLSMKNTLQQQPLGDTLRTGSGTNFYKSLSPPFANKTMRSNAYTEYETRMDRFNQTQTQNEEKAKREIEEMQRRYEEVKAVARQDAMEKLRQNKAYLKDLDTKGWENWKQNNEVKHVRVQKEKEFEDNMTQKMRKQYLDKHEFEKDDAVEGVKGFELNAQKLGVELEHDPEEIKTIEKGGITTNALMIKLREQANQAELARKEKDKRLRKMKVDQEKAQIEVETKKNEEILLEKFMNNSKKENEACYSRWRAARMEDVLTGNRNVREDALKEKKRLEIEKAEQEKERANRKPTDDEKRDARLRKLAQREAALEQVVQKRKKHHVICNHLMNQILELVEMCHQQQEAQENTQLESKNWRTFSILFQEDQINPPKKKIRHLDGGELGKSTIEAQQNLERFTLAELHNYLNGYGQWQPFHQAKPITSSSQSKQAIGPADEFNVPVPEKPINNTDLGSLVQNIIDMKYPPKQRPNPSSDIPNHLPLRLLALGYPFSGRKTVSNFLKQKYGVEVLKMDEILKEAVDLNAPPPVEDPKKAKKGGKKEVEVPKPENTELKALGLVIKELQEKQEEIPTEIYIDAFRAKIKELFPPQTEDQIIDELKKYKQKEADRVVEAQAQLAKEEAKKKKDPKAKAAAAAQNEESQTVPKRPYYTRGWILINFPGTYQQAKEFEQVISGYTLEEELLNHEAEDRKRRANVIVEAPAKPPAQDRFIEGGIDCSIKIEVSEEESLRRALGRRVDPNTGNIYHLQDNPPPPNDAKLNDRLQPINDPEATEERIKEKVERYDEEGPQIEGWYAMFGDEEGQIDCLQRFEGVGKAGEVNARVEQYLEGLLDFKMKKYDQMIEQYETKKQLELKQQQEEAERAAKRQAEEAAVAEAEALKAQQQQQEEEQKATIEQNLEPEIKTPAAEVNSATLEIAKSTIPMDQSRGSPDPDTIGTDRSDYNMRKDALETLNTLWETIQENYIGVAKEVFNNINEQRNFITSRFAEIQVRFLEVLRKQADKLVLLKKFNDRYNRFIEDNPEILDDPETKQELQIKLEELTDSLWVLVEAKKDLAVTERKGIMDSGYIEEEMDFFISNVQKLAQGELERYFGSVKLIKDYYQAIQNRAAPFNSDLHPIEVLPPPEYAPPIESAEDPDSFPRVDTLYANALRILNGEDLLPSELRRSKNNSFSMMGRSGAMSREDKKRRIDSAFSYDKKNQTALDKEAEEIIAVEKSIIKYRLFLLYSITISRLKEMRLMAKSLYNKLDDWIIYGIKAENDILYEQTKIIKKSIDKTEKLPKDLSPNFPEISSTHKPVNYLDLPPIILPKLELVQPNRFTLSNLFSLTEELKFLQDDNADLSVSTLIQFFNRRLMSGLSKNDFPAEWINQGVKRTQKIIESLDTESSGVISWKSLCTLLCLFDAPIPTQAEIDEYAQNLLERSENGEIESEAFARCPSFFDQQDLIPFNLPNHPVFDRVYLLKLLLFSIHKELEHDVVNVDGYIQTIIELRPVASFAEPIIKDDQNKRASKESIKKAKSLRKTYINAFFE